MFKVRTYNQISVKGLERFHARITKSAAISVARTLSCCAARSCRAWKCPGTLLAAARAGAGVNNVPVAEYSKLGIVVFNTPVPTPMPSRNW
jgi:D-3-phosphoglycerate dehydrogenase